jgi:hypothetical protein
VSSAEPPGCALTSLDGDADRGGGKNGPASVHSEYVMLADIVITADTTVFAGGHTASARLQRSSPAPHTSVQGTSVTGQV